MRRVSVVGISGSGKSTLSRRLAAALDAPRIELDGIFHQPNWTPLPREVFRARLAPLLRSERWVVDGNYGSKVQDLVWDAADTVVWLDLPRRAILPGLLARTLRRMWTREPLWNDNRERWRHLFDPRPEQNILLWMLTQHGRQRRRNERGLTGERWSRLALHRLRSRGEAERFLQALEADRGREPVG